MSRSSTVTGAGTVAVAGAGPDADTKGQRPANNAIIRAVARAAELAPQAIDDAKHFIRRLDYLGVDLIRTLG
jgi:hypothetical protein